LYCLFTAGDEALTPPLLSHSELSVISQHRKTGIMMKLIGMMDSPYVRRVAISLELYGVEFESHPLSVFSSFEAFSGSILRSKRRRWCWITEFA
jgi:hypothetical protein